MRAAFLSVIPISLAALFIISMRCTTARSSAPVAVKAADDCAMYEYAPAPVVLKGTISLETKYGPPGYGGDPVRDTRGIFPMLVLDNRISTRGIEGNDINHETFYCVEKVQVVNAGDLASHAGKRVSITGVLFQAHTGHHHTDVLIEAREIAPPVDKAVVRRFSASMLAGKTSEMEPGGMLLRVLGWSKNGRIAYLRGEIPRGPVGGMTINCKIVNLDNGETLYNETLQNAGDCETDANLAGRIAFRLDQEGIIPGEPRLEKLPVHFDAEGVSVSLRFLTHPDGSRGTVVIVKDTRAGRAIEHALGERESIKGLYRSPYGPRAAIHFHSSPGNTAAPENEFEEYEDLVVFHLTGGF